MAGPALGGGGNATASTSASASSSNSQSGPVSEVEVQNFLYTIPNMLAIEIKGILRDFASHTGARIPITGNKTTLINRVEQQVQSWQRAGKWYNVRTAIRLGNSPRDSRGMLLDTGGSSGIGSVGLSTSGNARQPFPAPSAALKGAPASASPYNPWAAGPSAPNGRAGYGAVPGPSRVAGGPSMPGKMNFKTSPFYKVERFIGSTVTIYEAAQNQRKSAFIEFRLSPDLIRLVKPERPGTDPTHQLRLFCTTKASAEVAERVPATVEFPTSCELRINTTPYSSSLKGSKKQAGRVPPPNLNKDKTLITREGLSNKIELVYANVVQKYVMMVGLCSITTPETLVDQLKADKRRSREEIISSMKRAAEEEDIEIGTSTLSLRDPLMLTRISAPCRSMHCSHSQCFDALTFFLSNEQVPSWNCPHCNTVLRVSELFIDGYFEDILSRVPDSEDAVEVDADGSWRTKDGKISSSAARVPIIPNGSSTNSGTNGGPKPPNGLTVPKREADLSNSLPPATPTEAPVSQSVVPEGAEVLELDDTPTPPSSSSPARPAAASTLSSAVPAAAPAASVAAPSAPAVSAPSSSSLNGAARPVNRAVHRGTTEAEAIDLTLSDSDDDDAPLAARPLQPPPLPPPASTSRQSFQPRIDNHFRAQQATHQQSAFGAAPYNEAHSQPQAQQAELQQQARWGQPPQQVRQTTGEEAHYRSAAMSGPSETTFRSNSAPRSSISNYAGPYSFHPGSNSSAGPYGGASPSYQSSAIGQGGFARFSNSPSMSHAQPGSASASVPPAVVPSSVASAATPSLFPAFRQSASSASSSPAASTIAIVGATGGSGITVERNVSNGGPNGFYPATRPAPPARLDDSPPSATASRTRLRDDSGQNGGNDSSEADTSGEAPAAKRMRQEDVVAPSVGGRGASTPLPSVSPSPPQRAGVDGRNGGNNGALDVSGEVEEDELMELVGGERRNGSITARVADRVGGDNDDDDDDDEPPIQAGRGNAGGAVPLFLGEADESQPVVSAIEHRRAVESETEEEEEDEDDEESEEAEEESDDEDADASYSPGPIKAGGRGAAWGRRTRGGGGVANGKSGRGRSRLRQRVDMSDDDSSEEEDGHGGGGQGGAATRSRSGRILRPTAATTTGATATTTNTTEDYDEFDELMNDGNDAVYAGVGDSF